MDLKKIQHLAETFLEGTNKLVTGPLKRKSKFGAIVEGTFRRDYLTLQTINLLSNKPEEEHIIYGNSCMDLFRRVFEDMVALEFMLIKDKEDMAEKFIAFKAVEAMRDINYLKKSGAKIDPTFEADILKDFEAVKKRFTDKKSPDGVRRSWAGVSVEQMIDELLLAGVIKEDEKQTLIQSYQAGCYKNHFSPSDIHVFLSNDLFEFSNKSDMKTALIFTLMSVAKIAGILIEECDGIDRSTNDVVEKTWNTLLNAHLSKVLD